MHFMEPLLQNNATVSHSRVTDTESVFHTAGQRVWTENVHTLFFIRKSMHPCEKEQAAGCGVCFLQNSEEVEDEQI